MEKTDLEWQEGLQPIVIEGGVAFADDEDTGIEGPARINIPQYTEAPQGAGASEEEVDDMISHVMTVAQIITSPVAAEGADPSSLPDATTQVDLLDDMYVQPILAEGANANALPDDEEATVSDLPSWASEDRPRAGLIDEDDIPTERVYAIAPGVVPEIEGDSEAFAP